MYKKGDLMYILTEEDRLVAVLQGNKMAQQSPSMWYLIEKHRKNSSEPTKACLELQKYLKQKLCS